MDIISRMLELNPVNRITCSEILKHEYFSDIKNIVPPDVYRRYEQDILPRKPLFLKSFQPAKPGKTAEVEQPRKIPQLINFHNVGTKTRHNNNNNTHNQGSDKPQFLRQKKSTSLDDCENKNKFNNNLSEKNLNGKDK
jgi:serine/threonine protein kinase